MPETEDRQALSQNLPYRVVRFFDKHVKHKTNRNYNKTVQSPTRNMLKCVQICRIQLQKLSKTQKSRTSIVPFMRPLLGPLTPSCVLLSGASNWLNACAEPSSGGGGIRGRTRMSQASRPLYHWAAPTLRKSPRNKHLQSPPMSIKLQF